MKIRTNTIDVSQLGSRVYFGCSYSDAPSQARSLAGDLFSLVDLINLCQLEHPQPAHLRRPRHL
jgi:hypothetical protein